MKMMIHFLSFMNLHGYRYLIKYKQPKCKKNEKYGLKILSTQTKVLPLHQLKQT